MNFSSQDMLRRLGAGEPIARVCEAAGITRAAFAAWWQAECQARVPGATGQHKASVQRPVRIERDRWGKPHVYADNDADLFFGLGYAMAQDRLFQLDFYRRRASGRLAEVLGAEAPELDLLSRVAGPRSVLELDLLARTVGLRRIAEHEWTTLAADTRALITAFSAGINAHLDECRDRLPIEFDLLDYRPEPWSPIDCMAIEKEFAWYLTGRFPVIVIPELAKRVLGDGPSLRAFFQVEDDDESILPPDSYPAKQHGTQPVGVAAGDPDGGVGSNNWVIAGKKTTTGKPLVASDPHIAFEAVSCWYEAHLCGGSFNVAGCAYVGMPGILFGRTERVAWGCTNNICSQRDLYQEKSDPAHSGSFLFDGRWEPARQREETIAVKGGAPVKKMIRFSRNGPIVDDVLPALARKTGPVALKWLGAYHGGWTTAVIGMNRARSATEFREALRPWHVPTFSLVFADVEGHIGFQSTGRIPVRNIWERGYRPGWLPEHQWQGLIPFEGMPQVADPERGWIASANNRVAPDDFPYPLSGTWNECLRARRIHQMIEAKSQLTPTDCAAMHQDALALRAVRCVPGVVKALSANPDARLQQATRILQAWDCRMEPDRVGATLFEVFFANWTKTVARERFDAETASLVAGNLNGLSASLLAEDAASWFKPGRREKAIGDALAGALDWLASRLGADMNQWTWGKLHVLTLRHFLSGRGDLAELLDHGGLPVKGTSPTICSTTSGANFEVRMGASYRLVVDLSVAPPVMLAVDSQSQSGHPGSPHYRDQLETWVSGKYCELPLRRDSTAVKALILEPSS